MRLHTRHVINEFRDIQDKLTSICYLLNLLLVVTLILKRFRIILTLIETMRKKSKIWFTLLQNYCQSKFLSCSAIVSQFRVMSSILIYIIYIRAIVFIVSFRAVNHCTTRTLRYMVALKYIAIVKKNNNNTHEYFSHLL